MPLKPKTSTDPQDAAETLALQPREILAHLSGDAPVPVALRRFLNAGWPGYEIRFLAPGHGHDAGDIACYGTSSITLSSPAPEGWCPTLDAARSAHAAFMRDDQAEAGRAPCPNQARLQRQCLRIRSLGKIERPAYRGGNGYPRLEGDA